MNNFKASFILSKCEAQYLLTSIPNVPQSAPVQYILENYLSDSLSTHEAIEGLVYKRLAKKTDGEVVLEPVVNLLTRLALSSDTLWIVDCEGDESQALVLKSCEVFLHVRCYPYTKDGWRISPYQDKSALLEEFADNHIVSVICVGENGKLKKLTPRDDSWIEVE